MGHAVIATSRRQQILEYIEQRHSVTVSELCSLLDVSEGTIRRDLRYLSGKGLLQRVHGGAVSTRGRSYEPPSILRSATNLQSKEAIARAAAKLVKEGDSIALDVGTTTLALARALVGITNLTIVTASLPIANVLANSPNTRLILTGGILRNNEHSMVGHIAARTYNDFYFDKSFVGVGGFDLDAGLTEYNLSDTLVKQAMMKHCKQVIVLADSSKIGRTCFTWIAATEVVDLLVTDNGIEPDHLQAFRDTGLEVIVAEL